MDPHTPPTPPGFDLQSLLTWVATAGVGLLTAAASVLWRMISQSEDTLRREAEERDENYKETTRLIHEELKSLWSNLDIDRRGALVQNENIMDRIAELSRLVAKLPERDEVRQDRMDMENRILLELRSKRP